MKVLRVHAPGTSAPLAAAVSRAIVDFNRGLDIRLRFLSIGLDDRVLEVPDAAGAAELVAAAMKAFAPEVVVIFGEGPAALAAAASAARERAVLARAGAGRREGGDADAARAIDRLAALHLAHGPNDAAALAAEGVATQVVDVGDAADAGTGERVVRALSRARRTVQASVPGGQAETRSGRAEPSDGQTGSKGPQGTSQGRSGV